MSIGNQAGYSITSLNAEIANVAVNFHNSADHAQDFFERINALGVVGLKAIGFSEADANNYYNIANTMNLAALIWFGQATLPAVNNFDLASAAVR